jgi:hypothetical protein
MPLATSQVVDSAQLVVSKIIDETDAFVPHKKAAPVKWYYYSEDLG